MNADIGIVFDYLSMVVGILAIAIILWGVVLGILSLTKCEIRKLKGQDKSFISLHNIRHQIGAYLLLGLEFLIAADIIRTFVKPSLDELFILGGLVIIRTIISFFLHREFGQDDRSPVNYYRKTKL